MAPKNKPGDNFTWKKIPGSNAWSRDFSRPYKEKKKEDTKKETKRKTTRKSSAPSSSVRPKKRDETKALIARAGSAIDRAKADKPKGGRGSEKGIKTSTLKPKEISGIGADMPPQQKTSGSGGSSSLMGKRGVADREGKLARDNKVLKAKRSTKPKPSRGSRGKKASRKTSPTPTPKQVAASKVTRSQWKEMSRKEKKEKGLPLSVLGGMRVSFKGE